MRRSVEANQPVEVERGSSDPGGSAAAVDEPTRLLVAARRNPEALRQFYLVTVHDILRYFRNRVYDPEIAKDLTSETYAALLHSLRRFDATRGSARQFLFGIAHNQLLMWRRKGEVSARYQRRLGFSRGITESNDDEVVERADFSRLAPRLHQALAAMKADDRLVIQLRLVDQLAYREIADRLQCNVGAARVRASRALARLSAAYDGLERGELR